MEGYLNRVILEANLIFPAQISPAPSYQLATVSLPPDNTSDSPLMRGVPPPYPLWGDTWRFYSFLLSQAYSHRQEVHAFR